MKNQQNHIHPIRLVSGSFLSFICMAAFLFSLGCSQQEAGNKELVAGNTTEMTIPVEGMSCNSCVANVKSSLKPMEGIERVAVSLAERNATISYDPQKVTPAQVQKAINALGYKAGEPVTNENK